MNTVLIITAIALGAPALKDKPPAKASIVGKWTVESRFNSGTPSEDTNVWIFSPDGSGEIRSPVEHNVISKLTYSLGADGQSNAIDIWENQPAGQPANRPGIYRIEKDTLTLSFVTENMPRPKSFDTSKVAGYFVMVFKRVPEK